MPEAERLADHRRRQGWSVAVVDIEDIYDGQSGGEPEAQALDCFMEEVQARWRRVSSYVFLLGDASIDPMGHLGLGAQFEVVPTRLVADRQMETASDLSLFRGKARRPLRIGRLPARTREDAAWLIDQTLAAEVEVGPETRRALIISDDRDPQSNPFAQDSLQMLGAVPAGVAIQTLDVEPGREQDARQAM